MLQIEIEDKNMTAEILAIHRNFFLFFWFFFLFTVVNQWKMEFEKLTKVEID